MDDRRFDALTRGFIYGGSRRGAIRVLAGSLLGMLPSMPWPDVAIAKCVALGKKCNKQQDRCCGGAKCKGRCKCRAGKKPCNGECIAATSCCPSTERPCHRGCVPNGTCCPGVERTCADGRCVPFGGCCGNADCNGGVCADGACQRAPHQGICTAQTDFCGTGAILECGTIPGLCSCFVRSNGLSFCAENGAGCVDCTSDAQCESALSAPGAICVRGGACSCSLSGTSCWRPCSSPA